MERLRRIDKEFVVLVIMALGLFSARSSLADHYVVPTSSMEYTLMPGDRVLVDKFSYGLRVPFLGWRLTEGSTPQVGEVVVFDSPESGKRLIKRVVAVGGDRVEVREGHLFLNGDVKALPTDPEVEVLGDREVHLNLSNDGGQDLGPLTLQAGQVLVMGDFRGNSRDGRMFGLLSETDVYGRAIAVFLRRGEGFVWKPL